MPHEDGKKVSRFERAKHDWYVEPDWAVSLLIAAVPFEGAIYDPCCGMGTIPKAFEAAGFKATGTDLIDRGYGVGGQDFLKFNRKHIAPTANIVMNPPYKLTEAFIDQALRFATDKVAVVVPLNFLCSKARHGRYQEWPIWRILILSSRPSMLPGVNLLAGEKAGGGAIDYCWLVFKKGYTGLPGVKWLARADQKVRRSSIEGGANG